MEKSVRQTAQTKENLRNAFWNLYAEKSVTQITVREITDRAGYNRGTFYVYYADVYDILEQTEEELLQKLKIHPLPAGQPWELAEIERTFSYVAAFFAENQQYLKILLGERGDPRFVRRLQQYFHQQMEVSMRRFCRVNDVTFDYILDYSLIAQSSMMAQWVSSDCNLPIAEMAKLVHRLMMQGSLPTLMGREVPEETIAWVNKEGEVSE